MSVKKLVDNIRDENISKIEFSLEHDIMFFRICDINNNIIKQFNLGKNPIRKRYKSSEGTGYYLKDIHGTSIDFEVDNCIRILDYSIKLYHIKKELYIMAISYLDSLDKKSR